MGHQVIKCDYCGASVMEGHNDWECDCGAICDKSTGYKWEKEKMKMSCTNQSEGDTIRLTKELHNLNLAIRCNKCGDVHLFSFTIDGEDLLVQLNKLEEGDLEFMTVNPHETLPR